MNNANPPKTFYLGGEGNMENFKIGNMSQYLKIVEQLKIAYPIDPIMGNPAAMTLIFRGVNDEAYTQLPSVFREVITQCGSLEIKNSKYIGWTTEIGILKSFQGEASAYIKDIPPTSLCKWAEYAQHYNVPTRFLDWTSNPLVALYFACKNNRKKDGAVWFLHPTNYRRFLASQTNNSQTEEGKVKLTIEETINQLLSGEPIIDYPIIYKPYYVDTRMSAQSCLFMVWGNKREPLEQFIPRENYMLYKQNENGVQVYGKEQEQHLLLKLFVDGYQKQYLLRQLDMMGINEKTLFPGLDGIGRYIEKRYRFNYYEAIKHL